MPSGQSTAPSARQQGGHERHHGEQANEGDKGARPQSSDGFAITALDDARDNQRDDERHDGHADGVQPHGSDGIGNRETDACGVRRDQAPRDPEDKPSTSAAIARRPEPVPAVAAGEDCTATVLRVSR
jgi:hypothetical protein